MDKNTMRILSILLLIFSAFPALGQEESQTTEEVLVIGTLIPTEIIKLARMVTIIESAEIASAPVRSVAELLKYVMSVDLRQRAPFGVQADLTIRGSKFTQVQVLINGIKVHDPQTAHHNMDIPISISDIERIEILNGQGSAAYGENAIGGVINIVTRTTKEKKISGGFSYGEHDTVSGNMSFTVPLDTLTQTVSLDYQKSGGFMYDRDFETFNITSISSLKTENLDLNFLIGHNRKVFGANGFYAPYASKEWTRTTFTGLTVEFGQTSLKAYFRQHHDRFMLDIERPELFQSSHQGRSLGFEGKSSLSMGERSFLLLGGEVRRDEIDSASLGDHGYLKLNVFSEYRMNLNNKLQVNAGLRGDYFSNYGGEIAPSLSLSYLVSPRMKLRSSIGHAFRVPTFTELYYKSPANRGNPDLKPERSLSFEIGSDFYPSESIKLETTVFYRADRNLIDWIKREDDIFWHSENIRNVGFFGVETLFRLWGCFNVGYTFLRSKPDSPKDFQSKYALNHTIHQITSSINFALHFETTTAIYGTYKKREEEAGYAVIDLKLTKSFREWEFFIQVTNLFNVQYEEIHGVLMPGRWLMTGIKIK
jgi:iron complex outermembrane receptor protein